MGSNPTLSANYIEIKGLRGLTRSPFNVLGYWEEKGDEGADDDRHLVAIIPENR